MKHFLTQLGMMYAENKKKKRFILSRKFVRGIITEATNMVKRKKVVEPAIRSAVVKRIKVGTTVRDRSMGDTFIEPMTTLIGKTIQVKRYKDSRNWFKDVQHDNYYWHRTWLDFNKG